MLSSVSVEWFLRVGFFVVAIVLCWCFLHMYWYLFVCCLHYGLQPHFGVMPELLIMSRLTLAISTQDWWEDGMDLIIFLPKCHISSCVAGPGLALFSIAWLKSDIWNLWPKLSKSKIREEIFVLAHVLGYSLSRREEIGKCEAASSYLSRWGRRVVKYRLDFSSLYSVWNWGPWDNAKYLYWCLLCSPHPLWNLFTDKEKGIAIQLINIEMNGYTRWRVRVSTKDEHSTSLSCWDVIFCTGANPPLFML